MTKAYDDINIALKREGENITSNIKSLASFFNLSEKELAEIKHNIFCNVSRDPKKERKKIISLFSRHIKRIPLEKRKRNMKNISKTINSIANSLVKAERYLSMKRNLVNCLNAANNAQEFTRQLQNNGVSYRMNL